MAILIPPFTMASAEPRRSGAAEAPASALAPGTYTPAANASKMRAPISDQYPCADHAIILANENSAIAMIISLRRLMPAVAVVSNGELMA